MCDSEDFADDIQDEAWTLAMQALEDWGDLTALADFFRLEKQIKPRVANILARVLFGDPPTGVEPASEFAVEEVPKNRNRKKRKEAIKSLNGVPPGLPNVPGYRVRVQVVAPNNRPLDPYRSLETYDAAAAVSALIEKRANRDQAIKQLSRETGIRPADIRFCLQISENREFLADRRQADKSESCDLANQSGDENET
jgi:hypothetical protein